MPAEATSKNGSSSAGALAAPAVIRDFEGGDAPAFRLLNEEWIRRYFVLEAKDEEAFADPEGAILSKGGRILVAEDGRGEVVGCCGLVPMPDRTFEVVKMAVAPRAQGRGLGRRLLERAVEVAREQGAKRLYLETNRILTPAIRIYRAVGFEELPPERVVPSPYARANVFMEMFL